MFKHFIQWALGLFQSTTVTAQWDFPATKEATPCDDEKPKKRKTPVKKAVAKKPKVVAKTTRVKKAKA